MRTDRERPLSVEQAPSSHSSEDVRAVAFFGAVHRAFEEAERVAGSVVRSYEVGEYPIRLRFAGPALVPGIAPALEHLVGSTDPPPALTICLCDTHG
jgi:hypothetical protein